MKLRSTAPDNFFLHTWNSSGGYFYNAIVLRDGNNAIIQARSVGGGQHSYIIDNWGGYCYYDEIRPLWDPSFIHVEVLPAGTYTRKISFCVSGGTGTLDAHSNFPMVFTCIVLGG